MNNILLRGIIKDIEYSHTLLDTDYEKAHLIVKRKDGKEDCIDIKFKKFSNPYKENDLVSLIGNIRSFSQQLSDTKNKVQLYVFTYFDDPGDAFEDELVNYFEVDGRVCKVDEFRTTSNGKQNLHFILANNLIVEATQQKLNSYLPCIAWGKLARELQQIKVNDKMKITGELHSRIYKKLLPDGNFEFRVAHECVISSYELL